MWLQDALSPWTNTGANAGCDLKWIAFYDAQYNIERARWNVLRLTGELTGAIEGIK
jgi:hypothetical protein